MLQYNIIIFRFSRSGASVYIECKVDFFSAAGLNHSFLQSIGEAVAFVTSAAFTNNLE